MRNHNIMRVISSLLESCCFRNGKPTINFTVKIKVVSMIPGSQLCDDFQLSFKSDSGTMTHERVYRKRHALLNCISMLSSVFMFYVVIHNYSCFTCKNSTRQLLAMISSFGGTMTRERVSLLGLSRLLILHVIS
jgi:hypothetical protein